jgi:hypothetical protein
MQKWRGRIRLKGTEVTAGKQSEGVVRVAPLLDRSRPEAVRNVVHKRKNPVSIEE